MTIYLNQLYWLYKYQSIYQKKHYNKQPILSHNTHPSNHHQMTCVCQRRNNTYTFIHFNNQQSKQSNKIKISKIIITQSLQKIIYSINQQYSKLQSIQQSKNIFFQNLQHQISKIVTKEKQKNFRIGYRSKPLIILFSINQDKAIILQFLIISNHLPEVRTILAVSFLNLVTIKKIRSYQLISSLTILPQYLIIFFSRNKLNQKQQNMKLQKYKKLKQGKANIQIKKNLIKLSMNSFLQSNKDQKNFINRQIQVMEKESLRRIESQMHKKIWLIINMHKKLINSIIIQKNYFRLFQKRIKMKKKYESNKRNISHKSQKRLMKCLNDKEQQQINSQNIYFRKKLNNEFYNQEMFAKKTKISEVKQKPAIQIQRNISKKVIPQALQLIKKQYYQEQSLLIERLSQLLKNQHYFSFKNLFLVILELIKIFHLCILGFGQSISCIFNDAQQQFSQSKLIYLSFILISFQFLAIFLIKVNLKSKQISKLQIFKLQIKNFSTVDIGLAIVYIINMIIQQRIHFFLTIICIKIVLQSINKLQIFQQLYLNLKTVQNYYYFKFLSIILKSLIIFHFISLILNLLPELNHQNNWYYSISIHHERWVVKYYWGYYYAVKSLFTIKFIDIHQMNHLEAQAMVFIFIVNWIVIFYIAIQIRTIFRQIKRNKQVSKNDQIDEDLQMKTNNHIQETQLFNDNKKISQYLNESTKQT